MSFIYPIEAVKTNVLGTENLLEAAIQEKVAKVICLSTDKAVYPINAMGISKALMEKVVIAKARTSESTLICATRYGNVMGSRGSVIPLFLKQISENKSLTITNPDMTRFMMSLEDAVDLVLYAFNEGKSGDIFVQKAPASTIGMLAEALLSVLSMDDHNIKLIGTRHGEKLYEVLCSKEEMLSANDEGNYFRIPSDNRDLNYDKFFNQGSNKLSSIQDYNSHNTDQLDKLKLSKLLQDLSLVKDFLKVTKINETKNSSLGVTGMLGRSLYNFL